MKKPFCCLFLFPNSLIVISDPAPHRSSGFAVMRAKNVTKELKRARRLPSTCFMFHGRRSAGNSHEPGGKFPVDVYFHEGVIPKVETWATVFERCYAAVGAMIDDKSVGPSQLDILKFVKIMFWVTYDSLLFFVREWWFCFFIWNKEWILFSLISS